MSNKTSTVHTWRCWELGDPVAEANDVVCDEPDEAAELYAEAMHEAWGAEQTWPMYICVQPCDPHRRSGYGKTTVHEVEIEYDPSFIETGAPVCQQCRKRVPTVHRTWCKVCRKQIHAKRAAARMTSAQETA